MNWQDLIAQQGQIYPDKTREWHNGYFAGCRYEGTASPTTLAAMPGGTEFDKGFKQACNDVALSRPVPSAAEVLRMVGEPVPNSGAEHG